MEERTNLPVIPAAEAEVMNVVWDHTPCVISNIVDRLTRTLAYTTVMTTMKILEDKNVVRRGDKVGRAFSYTANVSRDQVRESMLKSLADQLFGGSIRSLVLNLIESDAVSKDDIEAVRKAAAKLEKSP